VETYIYFAASAVVSRLVPIGVAARRWASLSAGGRLLLAFIVLSLVGDVVMYVLGRGVLRRNNLWVSHVLIAIQTPILLLAFRKWIPPRFARMVAGVAVAAVAAWFVLTLAMESPTRFARVTGPLQAGLFCVVAATTLVLRALSEEGRPTRSDWFWASIAVLLVYGLTAVHRPLLDLSTERGVTAIPAWTVLKALTVLQVIANFLFAYALAMRNGTTSRPIPAPA
jgi:hypothetical protein